MASSGIRTYIATPAPSVNVMTTGGQLGLHILRVIEQRIHASSHLSRASSLQEIINDLSSEPGPHTIQIVGHGSPGRLSLGYFWDKSLYDLTLFTTLLDGNPDAHSLLTHVMRDRVKEVRLWGCYVGLDRANPSATGSSLLLALHNAWKCNVLASRSYASPAYFREDGRYTGARGGYEDGGWRLYDDDPDTQARAPRPGPRDKKLEILAIVDVPERGPLLSDSLRDKAITLDPDESKAASTYTQEVYFDELDHPLALDEVVLKISLDGSECLAGVIAGGELLRVDDPRDGSVRYFASDGGGPTGHKLDGKLPEPAAKARDVLHRAIERRILDLVPPKPPEP